MMIIIKHNTHHIHEKYATYNFRLDSKDDERENE